MNPFKPKTHDLLESRIQERIIGMLQKRGWFVLATHGNAYQMGFPDLYATHHMYRQRWIEVKRPGMVGSEFTKAQKIMFPKLMTNGTPIWILTDSTEEEYNKLFQPANCNDYFLLKILLRRRNL